jgi:glycosyltransferase involved in cell wall biosynthesis
MKVAVVRGAFLNPFELQSFYPLKDKHEILAVSSNNPIDDDIQLPLKKLWSPTDWQMPFKYPILNRAIGDAHFLMGLESTINGFDIAHVAETYFQYTKQAIWMKRKGQIKAVVSTCWETIPHNNESLRGRRKIKEFCRGQIDHYLTPTNLAKLALIEEGVDEKKITVVPMGIDTKKFGNKHKRDGEINILFVGRLVPEKGVLELLQAYSEIRKIYPDTKLTMIGFGKLADEAIKAGAIIRRSDYDTIQEEYAEATIFCLPSQNTNTWQEQYGMALVEAMASGLPVVTTRAGAIPEVCKDGAIYSKEKDSKDLYKKLMQLIEDPQKRNQISKNGLLVSKELDVNKIAKKIERVWELALEKA